MMVKFRGPAALAAVAALLGALRHGEPRARRSRSPWWSRTTRRRAKENLGSLTEVIERNPSDPGAYNTRGAAYARLGRYSDAIADFNKAVQLDPGNAPAYTNRALAFRQTNRNDAALADFTRAVEADAELRPGLYRPRQPPARPGELLRTP